MNSKNPNRIPAEETGNCQHWLAPEIAYEGELPLTDNALEEHACAVDTYEAHPEELLAGKMTVEELEEIAADAEKSGREAGYAKGYEEGFAEGKARAQHDCRDQSIHLQSIAKRLVSPLEEQQNQLEKLLLDMICQLTRGIIQREMQIDSTVILTLVKNAVAILPVGGGAIEIHVNPQDRQLIEAHRESVDSGWQWVDDEELTRGGCRVRCGDSEADASLDSQIDELLRKFLHHELSTTASTAASVVGEEKCDVSLDMGEGNETGPDKAQPEGENDTPFKTTAAVNTD